MDRHPPQAIKSIKDIEDEFDIPDPRKEKFDKLVKASFTTYILVMLLQSFRDYNGPEGKIALRDNAMGMEGIMQRARITQQAFPPVVVAAMLQDQLKFLIEMFRVQGKRYPIPRCAAGMRLRHELV